MLVRLLLVYCLEWMLGHHIIKVEVVGRLCISNSVARQLFVYTKKSSRKCERKCYVNTTQSGRVGGQIRPCLQLHLVHGMLRPAKLRLCSFGSLVVWILLRSQSDLLYRLNCHVDKQLVVRICSSLDSGLLATAIEESKSHQFYFKTIILRIAHFSP